MTTRLVPGAVLALLVGVAGGTAENAIAESRKPVRTIDKTIVVGESDPALWRAVLELLPMRPHRIEVLDLDSLSAPTRRRLGGLDAFVLQGSRTIVVIRQGRTLHQAEIGDAVDRLLLASLIWHELAHVNGLDERAALAQERWLWQRFIATGMVDGGIGLAYIARLADESRAAGASARTEAIVAEGSRTRSPVPASRRCPPGSSKCRGWESNPHALSGPGF
jgi:hypothetical protein